jgi:prepilin-type N-terminal cleavage/methylation domain-containing protein
MKCGRVWQLSNDLTSGPCGGAYTLSRASFGAALKLSRGKKIAVARPRSPAREVPVFPRNRAFTLIELLVVITIMMVLLGLLFPAFQGVQNQAKKTQAKNDLSQIITAVNAFYTEYGKYPLPTGASGDAYTYGGPRGESSRGLFDALRGLDATLNPRQIVFLSPPDAKDQTNPKGGIGRTDNQFYDPWGFAYSIRIDADYDNQVPNPHNADTGAGPAQIRQGVIAWSSGKDGNLGKSGNFSGSDDVISWQ